MAHNLICYLHILRTFLCSSIHFCMPARLTADLIWYHRWWDRSVRVCVHTCKCVYIWKTCVLFKHYVKIPFRRLLLERFSQRTRIVYVCVWARAACSFARFIAHLCVTTEFMACHFLSTLTPSLSVVLIPNPCSLTTIIFGSHSPENQPVTYDLSMSYKTMRCEPFSHILIRLLLIK